MYYLQLEYDNTIISIPFGKLKDIDNYTMQFSDRMVFLDRIISCLGLNINKNYISRIYLVDEENKDLEFDYDSNKCLPIRYNKDNYNVDSLRDNFILYLQQDHSRIRRYDLFYAKFSGMMGFKAGERDISDEEIKGIVYSYFKEHYKGIRKIYFDIKDDYKIKIDNFKLKDKEIKRDDLSKLESREDDYLQYLIELASRSDDDRLRAIEELSLMDIEELNKRLSGNSYGVIDGISDIEMIKNDDTKEIEELVGMDIEDIRKIAVKNIGRRR